LSNADLERMVDTSDEWIRQRTGIVERRIAEDERTSTLAIAAAKDALSKTALSPEQIELIIVATTTPDSAFPAVAALVKEAIGARSAAAFDLEAACSGFVYALVVAGQFLETGVYRHALVIGAEVMSGLVDWTDRNTCVLFGDGAGAVVLGSTRREVGVLGFVLGADGSGKDILYVPPAKNGSKALIQMDGREVYKFACRIMTKATKQAAKRGGISVADISLLIPHQANYRIIETVAKNLNLNPGQVFVNLDRYGNTSAASIHIALAEAAEQGRLKPGDNVVLVGFGAGLTWGAAVVKWSK